MDLGIDIHSQFRDRITLVLFKLIMLHVNYLTYPKKDYIIQTIDCFVLVTGCC